MSDEGPQARLVDLFGQALDQPEDQRACWARDACADDPDLCRQLLALLQADADRSDPLQQVIDVGADWIDSISLEHVQRLGPWRLLERIGEGGMGTVFLAERDDDEYRRRVAIKLIRGFPDRDRLERLRTERQILADLDHPNIAALLDGGSEQGQPWLAMEYIDGEPLDQWCATRGLSLAERTRLLIRVVEAVHYAHQHLVIHRDIKPGNVLVGGNGEPKLLDFGIAKMIETAEPDDQATRLRYYTPRYSSPEQVEGRAISTLSDVYSLGRLIETVLTAGRDHQTLPREPAAIIECATRIEPSERYSSAGALASDLQRWQDGRAVHALARKRGYRLWRFLVRHRLAVAGGLAGLCVAAALVTRIAVERGEARAAALRAGQTLAFLTGLIESARPEFAQGRDVTVAEVLERGGAQLDAAQSASPDLRAGIATTLASAWQALDELPKAAEL
jgi:serine/threonine-protein kinase